MKGSENSTKRVSGSLAKGMEHILTNPTGAWGAAILLFGIFSMLFIVGNDIVKVLLRRNVGIDKLDRYRFIFDIVIILTIPIWLFILGDSIQITHDSPVYNEFSLALVILVYFFIAFVFWKRSKMLIRYSKENNINAESDGESEFLSFLNTYEGWNERRVQYVAEPVYFIILGIMFSFINILGGIPLIYCGISVWGYQLLQPIIGHFNSKIVKPEQIGGKFHKVGKD